MPKSAHVKKEPLPVTSDDDFPDEPTDPALAKNVHELGLKLEEVVEKIYRAQGYATERRLRVPGKGNYTNEIDIVARKSNDSVAIECKNYKEPVGISPVRDFAKKLDDLGMPWRGVFVAFNDLTADAESFAEGNNIETFGYDELVERWLAVSVGRLNRKGENLTFDSTLSITVDYVKVTTLDIANKEKVAVSDARLVFHPYFKIPYRLDAKVRDPSREVHHFQDSGILVVDMLDGEVINPLMKADLPGLTKMIKSISSQNARQENARITKIIHEVSTYQPSVPFSLTIGQDYEVSKLQVIATKRGAARAAIEFITEKNSCSISYSTKKEDRFIPSHTMEFVPRRRDISLLPGSELIFVPKWSIHFSAFGVLYSKEVLAHSGAVLEDTMQFCPSHFKTGLFTVKKKTKAVCEVCGRAFCEEHIDQCAACGKWVCKSHSRQCSSCKKYFCPEHARHTCSICQGPLCSSCGAVCALCKKVVGKEHAIRCDICKGVFCERCVTVSGLIKKSRVCKKCSGG